MDFKRHFAKLLEDVCTQYIEDLQATPHEILNSSPGGQARTPYDFTYEVAYINNRLAKRMSGGDPGPWPFDGWVYAPDDFKKPEIAIQQMKDAKRALLEAWNDTPDSDLWKAIPLPNGETNPVDLMTLAITHTTYHDAQINYLQAAKGDMQVHWSNE